MPAGLASPGRRAAPTGYRRDPGDVSAGPGGMAGKSRAYSGIGARCRIGRGRCSRCRPPDEIAIGVFFIAMIFVRRWMAARFR
jgi:hypothetical protein